jgi:hypothetical protein
MKAKQDITFTVGAGGLIMVHLPNELRRVYVQVDLEHVEASAVIDDEIKPVELERFFIREVYLDAESRGFDADFFRAFPLTRIESLLNDTITGLEILERWSESTYADLNIAYTLSHFENKTENKKRLEEKINAPRAPRARTYKRPTLEPPTGKLTDSFLFDVAVVYRDARNHGEPPLRHLSELTETSKETVRYWVKQARARGFLKTVEQGKVI